MATQPIHTHLEKSKTVQRTLGLAGLVISLVVVVAAFWLCLFQALPLTVVWTALGFHISYQILYWNKRVSATAKGFEIKNEESE